MEKKEEIVTGGHRQRQGEHNAVIPKPQRSGGVSYALRTKPKSIFKRILKIRIVCARHFPTRCLS
jgi:hypothetical protein